MTMEVQSPEMGTTEWVDDWVAVINDDAQIARIGRFFEGRMCVQFAEDRRYILLIVRGRVLDVMVNPIWDKPYDFKVAASLETWQRSAEAIPRPFYQDIFGMMWNHGMTVEGNVVMAMQNIRALKLMLAAMKRV
jgi:hypothetical protein